MGLLTKKQMKHLERVKKARRKRFVKQERIEAKARGLTVKELRAAKFNENIYNRG